MRRCCLSTALDVYNRRLDRQNARLDALAVSLKGMCTDLRAWRVTMDAENAARRDRVAALLRQPPSFEALDAYLAQFDERQRQGPFPQSMG